MTEKLSATLKLSDGREISLDFVESVLGYNGINVQNLIKEKLFCYDPGMFSTAGCESSITYIDGDEGVLLHRGYPIAELAKKRSYLDVAYLLLFGELPSAQEAADFKKLINSHSIVHEHSSAGENASAGGHVL